MESEEVAGYLVLPDGELHLNSVMNVRGFVLPIKVKGTLDNPKIDFSKSLKDMLRNNAKELLKTENLEKAVNTVNDLIKAFR